jgi:hypothetical protein
MPNIMVLACQAVRLTVLPMCCCCMLEQHCPWLPSQGYSMYITIFYVLVAVVWAIVALTVWVATMMRKQDHAGSALNK